MPARRRHRDWHRVTAEHIPARRFEEVGVVEESWIQYRVMVFASIRNHVRKCEQSIAQPIYLVADDDHLFPKRVNRRAGPQPKDYCPGRMIPRKTIGRKNSAHKSESLLIARSRSVWINRSAKVPLRVR